MKRSRCEDLLAQLLQRVRDLKPGGDLEGLLEEGAVQVKEALYEEAARERQRCADSLPEAFSPSALSALRHGGPDARDRSSEASGADAGGAAAV